VHVASDISTRTNPEEVIAPTVSAVKILLEAAFQTPSVKRFVFTSSLAALPSAREAVDITASSWAPDSVIESAWAIQDSGLPEEQKGLLVYAASKTLAERACWDFVRERNPHFILNTVVPFTNLGAFVHPKLVSSFNGMVLGVWHGDTQAGMFLKRVMQGAGVSHIINLEDCGLLHVAALTLDDVKGERILGVVDAFKFNDILDVMKRLDPARPLPEPLEHEDDVKASIEKARCKELLAILGKAEPTGLEESIKQAITSGTGIVF
jgi:nucleoside-diphosphate-sugar epimerase